MSSITILTVAALYLLALYALARWGERRTGRAALTGRRRALVHGLALGVYCSTWTVFGAIGSAVREGYAYLPIYLGPLLVTLVTPFVWERLVRLKQRHRLASVADLLGARYGRGALPALVAAISLIAVVPYVALQLTALDGSLRVLGIAPASVWVLLFAALMVVFTLRFGVIDARTLVERPGLILVLAIESAIKLLILLLLALWAWSLAADTPLQWHRALAARAEADGLTLVGQTILAAAASLLLPRMFQVGVVECADPGELRLARWVFAAYLLLVSIAVLPIAAHAGAQTLSGSDHLLISLPLQRAQAVLALLAFLAGLSAASAMMIAAWLALSTMISNDLVMPLLLRSGVRLAADRVLNIRRGAVILTALMSVLWYSGASAGTLVQMGLLAFAGVAQFAPAVFAALYVPRSSGHASLLAMIAGALAWAGLLVVPYLSGDLPSTAELTGNAMLALAINTSVLVALSALKPASLRQRLQAESFLAPGSADATALAALSGVRADDLYALLETLLGAQRCTGALLAHYRAPLPASDAPATQELLNAAVRAVAEVFGSSSARDLIARGLRGRALSMDAVLNALDHSSARNRMNAQLLRATFEHMHQAVSVVDSDLRLAAWNQPYERLFEWPSGVLEPGQPIGALIAHAARASGLDEAAIAARVQRRLAQLRAATPYRSVRLLPDGRTLDVRGEPLPEGGFVTTFFDISESVRAARALEEANARLEERVAARTRELQRVGELKNQFLAAASHDLLQPLSAARLYLAAAQTSAGAERTLLERADSALAASEELLTGLTDLARLETGQLQPEIGLVDVGALFASLDVQAQALAGQRGLRLQVQKTRAWVQSDPRLLRRIVQNYLANALRYTARGGVLVGVRRRRGKQLEIMVCDSGPGIGAELLPMLFGELDRSASVSPWGERGLGLGLSGCKRLADALGHALSVRSRPGHGSCFSVTVPLASTPTVRTQVVEVPRSRLEALRILCVDDHPQVLASLVSLLTRWGAQVVPTGNAQVAQTLVDTQEFDVALVDFALGADAPNGLQLIADLRWRRPQLRAVLITAEPDPDLPARAAAADVTMLKKPLRPAALRALLESFAG
jgi:Na+/proline symporter/CheY-like chemotaxis protein